MKSVKVLKILANIWAGIVALLVFIGAIGSWVGVGSFWEGLNKFWDIFSPFNVANYVMILIFLSPSILLLYLAGRIEKKLTNK